MTSKLGAEAETEAVVKFVEAETEAEKNCEIVKKKILKIFWSFLILKKETEPVKFVEAETEAEKIVKLKIYFFYSKKFGLFWYLKKIMSL